MIKSFAISSIIIICIATAETSLLANITALPVVPDFLLLSTLYFSLLNGKTYGETAGFVSGLALDFMTGAPFGFNCIFRTIIGYAAGFFHDSLNFKGIFIPCMLGAAGTVSKFLLTYVISLFFPAITLPEGFLSFPFLFELGANTIFAPVLFKLLGAFESMIALRRTEFI
ncbi:MAG: rod shape-determining protein MreD [Treponema sp.]